jgi:hypothetical protein
VQELRRLFSVQEILMIHRQIIDDEIHANLDEGITNFEAGWTGVHKGFRGKPRFSSLGHRISYRGSTRGFPPTPFVVFPLIRSQNQFLMLKPRFAQND